MASASERLLEDISAARKLYADVEAISADGECISFRFGGEEFTVVLQGSYGEELRRGGALSNGCGPLPFRLKLVRLT